MSEADKPQQQPHHQFSIQRIYTKDISFETPAGPAVFSETWDPQVAVELNTQANHLGNGVFEVVLAVTVTTKVGEKTAYLVEVKQAGLFNATGFTDPELGQLLGSFCPNMLFPYVREVISDLVTRGSFPQLILNPVNFDVLYAQHLQQRAAAAAAAAPKTETTPAE